MSVEGGAEVDSVEELAEEDDSRAEVGSPLVGAPQEDSVQEVGGAEHHSEAEGAPAITQQHITRLGFYCHTNHSDT